MFFLLANEAPFARGEIVVINERFGVADHLLYARTAGITAVGERMAMEEYLLILKFTGFLILVALLAYFMIRFGLRRLQPSTGRGYIKVLQKVPLDVKGDRLLVLVRIEERILLLGSAQGNITVLQDFPAEALSLANGTRSNRRRRIFFSVAGRPAGRE